MNKPRRRPHVCRLFNKDQPLPLLSLRMTTGKPLEIDAKR